MAISSITFGFAGPKISRDLTFADNGDGTVTKTTNVTLPNGREVSREQIKRGEINQTLLSGGLNGLRGIRSYVPDTANTDESSKYISERGKIVRTILIDRPIAQLPPIAKLPPETTQPVTPSPISYPDVVEIPAEKFRPIAKAPPVLQPPIREKPILQLPPVPVDDERSVTPIKFPVDNQKDVLPANPKAQEKLQAVFEKLSARFDIASRAYQVAALPKQFEQPISLPPVSEVLPPLNEVA